MILTIDCAQFAYRGTPIARAIQGIQHHDMGADSLAALVVLGHAYTFRLLSILIDSTYGASQFSKRGRDINSDGQRQHGVNTQKDNFSIMMHCAVDAQSSKVIVLPNMSSPTAPKPHKASKPKATSTATPTIRNLWTFRPPFFRESSLHHPQNQTLPF